MGIIAGDVSGSGDFSAVASLTTEGALQVSGSVTLGDAATDITAIAGPLSASVGATVEGSLHVIGDADFSHTLKVSGSATLAADLDVDGTANLDNTDIDGTLVVDGSNISLDSTSTLNIDNSNTSNGITIGTATSGVPISIGHTTSETTVNDNLTVTGVLDVTDTTDSSDATGDTGALRTEGGASIAKKLFVGTDLDVDGTANLDNTDIDGTLVVDGTNISLDSTSTLNIDNSNTSNGITIGTATSGVPISIGHTTSETTVNDNLTVTGIIDITDTTDSSDATGDTGALRTEGGASIAKKLFVGTDLSVAGASTLGDAAGDITAVKGPLSASVGATVEGSLHVVGDADFSHTLSVSGSTTLAGVLDVTDVTDSSDATGDTGALRTEGGASIAKKLFVGTDLSVAGGSTLGDAAGDITAVKGPLSASVGVTVGGALHVVGDADFSHGVSVSGSTILAGNLTVGDGEAEDQKIVLDGNATDFYLGLDDTDDTFKLGLGSAVGTNAAFTIDTTGETRFPIASGVSGSGPVTFMGAAVLGSTLNVSGSATLVGGSATQIALDINAINTTADVIDITADTVTNAHVMDVTADGLVSGSILNLVSNSGNNGVRNLVKIHNDNAAADCTTCLYVLQDAIPDGGADENLEAAVVFETGLAGATMPLLRLMNSATDTNGAIMAFVNEAEGAANDDFDLGTIDFIGLDDGDDEVTYAQILAESSDVTNNDEGGKLTFNVFAGGTAGTAAAANLFSIGGEDVANSTPCEVVVNDASIDCDFRVESNDVTHMFFVDAGNNRIGFANSAPEAALSIGSGMHTITSDVTVTSADSGDNTVIAQLPGVVIPQHAIITRVIAVVKTASNLSTHLCNIQLSSTNGTAADSPISSGTEILGAGMGADAEDAYSTDNPGGDTKEDINLKEAKEVFLSEGILSVNADKFVYVCNAGSGNGTSNASSGVLTVIIEYFGMT
tara:strand:+ start:4967 stop:7843 length:2877 start_codon:yes stop_codon:yes gene_type:complete